MDHYNRLREAICDAESSGCQEDISKAILDWGITSYNASLQVNTVGLIRQNGPVLVSPVIDEPSYDCLRSIGSTLYLVSPVAPLIIFYVEVYSTTRQSRLPESVACRLPRAIRLALGKVEVRSATLRFIDDNYHSIVSTKVGDSFAPPEVVNDKLDDDAFMVTVLHGMAVARQNSLRTIPIVGSDRQILLNPEEGGRE